MCDLTQCRLTAYLRRLTNIVMQELAPRHVAQPTAQHRIIATRQPQQPGLCPFPDIHRDGRHDPERRTISPKLFHLFCLLQSDQLAAILPTQADLRSSHETQFP